MRFVFVLLLMVGCNLIRWAITWRDFGTCGLEQIGFPAVFMQRGGFSGAMWFTFYPNAFLSNCVVALLVAGASLLITRNTFNGLTRWLLTKEDPVEE